jgi:hypothetical protein
MHAQALDEYILINVVNSIKYEQIECSSHA